MGREVALTRPRDPPHVLATRRDPPALAVRADDTDRAGNARAVVGAVPVTRSRVTQLRPPGSAPLTGPLMDAAGSRVTDRVRQKRVAQIDGSYRERASDERAELERTATRREGSDYPSP